MCGHKDLKTKMDGKPFGFPFDRKISFSLKENQKYEDQIRFLFSFFLFSFITMAGIRIIYRHKLKQSEVGEKINQKRKNGTVIKTTTTTT